MDEQARGHRPERGDLVVQLVAGGRVHGEGDGDRVEVGFGAGDPVGQVVGVLGGGLHVRVEQAAVLDDRAPPGFEPAELAVQPGGRDLRVDRLDVHRHVHQPGMVGQRGQPARVDRPRIPGDGERGDPGVTDLQIPGTHHQRPRIQQPRRRMPPCPSARVTPQPATPGRAVVPRLLVLELLVLGQQIRLLRVVPVLAARATAAATAGRASAGCGRWVLEWVAVAGW